MPEALNPEPKLESRSLKIRLQLAIETAGAGEAAAMLDRLWAAGGFAVKRAPQIGLIMATVLDPFVTPFHLGEILATTAEVTLEGRRGHAIVSGDEPEKALLLAAVEAAEACGRTEDFCGLGEFIAGLVRRQAEHRDHAGRIAAATAVNFESMKKETVDFGSLGG